MSIVSFADPDDKERRETRERLSDIVGPTWMCCQDEDALMRRLNLYQLSENEKREAIEEYRKIANGNVKDPPAQYPRIVTAVCVIIAIILFVLGFCRG